MGGNGLQPVPPAGWDMEGGCLQVTKRTRCDHETGENQGQPHCKSRSLRLSNATIAGTRPLTIHPCAGFAES